MGINVNVLTAVIFSCIMVVFWVGMFLWFATTRRCFCHCDVGTESIGRYHTIGEEHPETTDISDSSKVPEMQSALDPEIPSVPSPANGSGTTGSTGPIIFL